MYVDLRLGSRGNCLAVLCCVRVDSVEGLNSGGALATVACHRFVREAERAERATTQKSQNDEDKMLIRLIQTKPPSASTEDGFKDSRISL